MKKEIREKVAEFKKMERDLIVSINKNPQDSSLKVELLKVKAEKRKWLNKVGGFAEGMNPEDFSYLESLVKSASFDISRAAKYEANLAEYISQVAENIKGTEPGYERIVDDKGQLVAIAEQSAMEKVRKLDKFNRKRNKQSFVNVVICKFKRPKISENTQDSQKGPTQG